jgi:phage replication O-like protein O
VRDLANVQLEKGYIRIATELMDEIIRRDFSKRQFAILHLIIRLSYGCHQKECVIEKLNDFKVIGIYKQDIKKELNYLEETKVIKWDREQNVFSLNKNYETWQINPSKGWEKVKFDSLIHLNIKHKKVSKTLTSKISVVSKTLTEMGLTVSKTLTDEFVKHLLEMFGNDWESKDEGTLKNSIKDIYLKIKDVVVKEDELMNRILDILNKSKILGEKEITEFLRDDITDIIDNFGFEDSEQMIIEAIKETARGNGKTWLYVYKKLVAWKKQGIKNLIDLENLQEKEGNDVKKYRRGSGKTPGKSKQEPIFGDKTGRL